MHCAAFCLAFAHAFLVGVNARIGDFDFRLDEFSQSPLVQELPQAAQKRLLGHVLVELFCWNSLALRPVLVVNEVVEAVHRVLESVLAQDITHPGSCHLYIHATEPTQVPGKAEDCQLGQVIEDVKMQSGHRTEIYKIKRALMDAMGHPITEY